MNDSKILPRREANAADFKVTKYTRAGKYGKAICCPECKDVMTVYHFAWSRLECLNCKQSVDKYDWRVIPTQGQLGTDSSNKIDEITDVFDNLEKENDSLISLLKEVN